MTVTERTFKPTSGQKLPWIETPLKESSALSRAAGCRIFLKLENLQPSGSFKSRGIGNYILGRLAESEAKGSTNKPHIFSSSGGNAGLAAVYASVSLNLPCTVVVPLSTKPLMIAKLKAAGAREVIQHGPTWKDADTYLREQLIPVAGMDAIYVPPFDHPDIWTGASTLMHEIAQQLPDDEPPSTIICSVGGGGLFNGINQGLNDLDWTRTTTILALETQGADSLAQSVEAGELITLPGITSLATSLGATRVMQQSLDYAKQDHVKTVVLPDAEAAMGCWRLADDERIMVELACGVNVALCYDGRLEKVLGRSVRPDEKLVIVVCGGSNVTVEMLHGWRQEFAWVENGIDADAPSSATAPEAGNKA